MIRYDDAARGQRKELCSAAACCTKWIAMPDISQGSRCLLFLELFQTTVYNNLYTECVASVINTDTGIDKVSQAQ